MSQFSNLLVFPAKLSMFSYVWIEMQAWGKSLGVAPGWSSARPPDSTKVEIFSIYTFLLSLLLWQYKRLDAQSKKNKSFGWVANRNQPQHWLKFLVTITEQFAQKKKKKKKKKRIDRSIKKKKKKKKKVKNDLIEVSWTTTKKQ